MVEKSSTLLPMYLQVQGERMRQCLRLSLMLAGLLALAPPANAMSPPIVNTNENNIELLQTNGKTAITDVTLTRSDQNLATIGDFLGANTQANTKIGRTPLHSSGDATIDLPDKIEAGQMMAYMTNATHDAIGTNFKRSTGTVPEVNLIYGKRALDATRYDVICDNLAGARV